MSCEVSQSNRVAVGLRCERDGARGGPAGGANKLGYNFGRSFPRYTIRDSYTNVSRYFNIYYQKYFKIIF